MLALAFAIGIVAGLRTMMGPAVIAWAAMPGGLNLAGTWLAFPYKAGGEVLMGTLRIEKENAVRVGAERKGHEKEQKQREVELILAERDLRLAGAQRDLLDCTQELNVLAVAETTSTSEGTQRPDEVVRKSDSKLVRDQKNGAKPESGKPRKPAASEPV